MKKFLPYILILVIMVGLFSPASYAKAAGEPACITSNATGEVANAPCIDPGSGKLITTSQTIGTGAATVDTCASVGGGQPGNTDYDNCKKAQAAVAAGVKAETPPQKTPFEKNVGRCDTLVTGDVESCIVKITYYIFYVLPAMLLSVAANSFNIIVALTLSSSMYTASNFIPSAWVVIRDFSNIFFILILLYISIKIILDLGGSEAKKTIVTVIIMALLINFSMFFTKVVIDSSNILALVFYNKINVNTEETINGQKQSRDYIPALNGSVTGIQDKDISGGLVSAFDPTKLLTEEFFKKAKEKTSSVGIGIIGTTAYVAGGAYLGSFIPVPILGTAIGAAGGWLASTLVGYFISTDKIPPGLMIGIIVIAGLIMCFAIYAFFVAGTSFIGRLIELWVLIIFSPFAFMSFTIPSFKKIEYIGWDAWLKRLLTVSFMAPIFMLFLYLIFKLVQANIFKQIADRPFDKQGTIEAIVLVVIPAALILTLLLKATEFAKKASGKVGEMLLKGSEIAGGIVGGLALGGAAAGLQATVGHLGSTIASSTRLAEMEGSEKRGLGGALTRFTGARLRDISGAAATGSFDARRGAVGAALGSFHKVTGIDLGHTSKFMATKDGGYVEDRKRRVEKRIKRAENLKVKEDEKLKQDLNKVEDEKESLAEIGSHEMGQIDARIEAAQKDSNAKSAKANAIDTKDSNLVKERTEKIKRAREMVIDTNNRDEVAKKTLAIKEAESMSVDDEKKVKEKNEATDAAKKAADYVVTLRAQKSAIGNANADNINTLSKAVQDANNALVDAETKGASEADKNKLRQAINAAEVAVKVAELARELKSNGGTGASINELNDNIIPDLKHAVEHESKRRARASAMGQESLNRFWTGGRFNKTNIGRAEVREAVHKIRMGAKVESHKGGGGGGVGFGGELAAEFIGEKLFSPKGEKH